MGRWDKYTDENNLNELFREASTIGKLTAIDMYDQFLLDMKKLYKERESAPINKRKYYDLAINKLVTLIHYTSSYADIPGNMVIEDLIATKKGGTYRNLTPIDYEGVFDEEERKKKSSKTKSKRKIVKKVIKKCKCKK
jgi:hypothetical protein